MRTAALLLAGSLVAIAPAEARQAPLRLERAVVVMRHGVRPPTKDPALKPELAKLPGGWPSWPVAPGYLTPHGADAVRAVAEADRTRLVGAGLLPGRGCPQAGAVEMVSDSDQRTIATGDAYLAGLAPGCNIGNAHRAQGEADPLFSPLEAGVTSVDGKAAERDIAAELGAGGVAALERRMQPALARIRAIYCAATPCPLVDTPSAIRSAPGGRPKLAGALDTGSTAAQILLLEYAEGKPLSEVGWGRARAADIALAGQLHSAEFSVTARPHSVAAANIKPIAERALAALADDKAPRLLLIVGHDTNVASLGGLLDLEWQAPGFARNDPAPGGALVLDLLRSAGGGRFVRISYRSQSLEAIRVGGKGAVSQVLKIPGCSGATLCPLGRFEQLVRVRIALAGPGRAH